MAIAQAQVEIVEQSQSAPRNVILQGDARALLRSLPEACVQTVVTSPPYYGLRSYGTEPQVWGGDKRDPQCVAGHHVWGPGLRAPWANDLPGPNGRKKNVSATRERAKETGPFCQLCGAWRGELGQEPSPDDFVAHLVEVFREVRRVLRPDGLLWVNISDSYAGSWGNYAPGGIKGTQRPRSDGGERWERPAYGDTTYLPAAAKPPAGLKNKDLCLVPARFVLAMQRDGWYVRLDGVWDKANGLPESVDDRPNRNHEYLFLFARSERYFSDMQAIAEPAAKGAAGSTFTQGKTAIHMLNTSQKPRQDYDTRHARSVWTLPVGRFKGGHYAVMSPEVAERCVISASAPRACEWCGAPYKRVTKRTPMQVRSGPKSGHYGSRTTDGLSGTMVKPPSTQTIGWRQTCKCADSTGSARCLVLDPFMGAGTTAIAAQKHDRDWLGCELQPKFARMAERRIRASGCEHAAVVASDDESAPDQLSLFA